MPGEPEFGKNFGGMRADRRRLPAQREIVGADFDGQPRQLTDAVDCVTSVPGEVWAMVGYTDDGNPSTVETDGVSVRFTDGDPPKLEKILLPKKDDYSPQYYNSDPGEQPAVTRSDATYTVKGTTTPVIPKLTDRTISVMPIVAHHIRK